MKRAVKLPLVKCWVHDCRLRSIRSLFHAWRTRL